MVNTTINDGYILIPEYLRQQLNIKENDKINIKLNEKGNLEIMRASEMTLDDLVGIIDDENDDAVEIKKKIARGEKIV